jgi:hypothetical protein
LLAARGFALEPARSMLGGRRIAGEVALDL